EYDWAGFKARMDVAKDHPHEPLALYLAYHNETVNRGDRYALDPIGGPATGFVQRLAAFRDLVRRWQTGQATSQTVATTKAEVQKTLAFAQDVSPRFAWMLLNVVRD